jgi:hypothetical protein
MSDHNAEVRQASPMDPRSLRLDDMARILTALGPKPVTIEMLMADIDDGAPVNADGTMNLLNYSAWLAKEILSGD